MRILEPSKTDLCVAQSNAIIPPSSYDLIEGSGSYSFDFDTDVTIVNFGQYRNSPLKWIFYVVCGLPVSFHRAFLPHLQLNAVLLNNILRTRAISGTDSHPAAKNDGRLTSSFLRPPLLPPPRPSEPTVRMGCASRTGRVPELGAGLPPYILIVPTTLDALLTYMGTGAGFFRLCPRLPQRRAGAFQLSPKEEQGDGGEERGKFCVCCIWPTVGLIGYATGTDTGCAVCAERASRRWRRRAISTRSCTRQVPTPVCYAISTSNSLLT